MIQIIVLLTGGCNIGTPEEYSMTILNGNGDLRVREKNLKAGPHARGAF